MRLIVPLECCIVLLGTAKLQWSLQRHDDVGARMKLAIPTFALYKLPYGMHMQNAYHKEKVIHVGSTS